MPITTLRGLISDTVFYLPSKDVQRSCGLALDIGATVGKIAYRSKKEYKNGQPITVQGEASRGRVHLAMFPRADVTGIITYINDNCDLLSDVAGEVVVTSAGLGAAAFRTEIETGLNCRVVKVLAGVVTCDVMDTSGQPWPPIVNGAAINGNPRYKGAFLAVEKTTPAAELFIPLSADNQALVAAGTEKHQAQMKVLMDTIKDHLHMKYGAAGPGKVEVQEEDRPRVLMMAGSACSIMQINPDGTCCMLDGMHTGGQTMYGLACLLTGENDFDKLVEMAESSDGKTVDISMSDLIGGQSSGRPKDNLYESMFQDMEDRRCFPFGKGVTTPLDKMKKGDLAFSVFNTMAEIHWHLLHSCVKQNKAREVYVCGNVFNTEFMRLLLSRLHAQQHIMLPPDLQYEMKFLRNGGMYGALGAFLNTE